MFPNFFSFVYPAHRKPDFRYAVAEFGRDRIFTVLNESNVNATWNSLWSGAPRLGCAEIVRFFFISHRYRVLKNYYYTFERKCTDTFFVQYCTRTAHQCRLSLLLRTNARGTRCSRAAIVTRTHNVPSPVSFEMRIKNEYDVKCA